MFDKNRRWSIATSSAAMAMAISLSLSSQSNAQSLRYDWKDGQKFSYQFDITVDSDDSTTSYKGITHYTVDKAGADQMRVTFRGGLNESSKSKQINRGRFGPRIPFGGPPRIPSPFERPTFAGKTQTTNRITITPRGNVLAMEGDSQLPYLLGNVSLLPFEALPPGDERQWKIDSGVSITEEDENRRHRFGPFDPFSRNDPKNVQAASEVTSYSIKSSRGDLVTIDRSYKLITPETADNPAFDLSGTGTWTFNAKENVPHALDMHYKLTVKKGNTTSTIPISLKFARISATDLTEMEAAAKQKAAELARAAAAAKAKAEAPLTGEEKQAALRALASSDAAQIEKSLKELAAKTPLDPDPEVADAIEKHLESANKTLAGAAHTALVNWSPGYKLVKSLEKAYQGPGVLKSTGRVVESTTPLYVGQIVQAQRRNRGTFWFAAKVEELLPDGKVQLGFLTWGEVRDSEAVERRQIQLAPEELPQPDRPKNLSSTTPAASRTWTDTTGRFELEAVFVGLEDGKVSLRRADNRVIAIPLEKLSAADQAHVEALNAENPFAVD